MKKLDKDALRRVPKDFKPTSSEFTGTAKLAGVFEMSDLSDSEDYTSLYSPKPSPIIVPVLGENFLDSRHLARYLAHVVVQ